MSDLREAARVMRRYAQEATTYSNWQVTKADDGYAKPWTVTSTHEVGERTWICENARDAGAHIAAWSPLVAELVADWLEDVADAADTASRAICAADEEAALAIAHQFLAGL